MIKKSIKILLWLFFLAIILAVLLTRFLGIGIKLHDGRYLGYSSLTHEWLLNEYRNTPVRQDGPYVFNDSEGRRALYITGDGISASELIIKKIETAVEVVVDNDAETRFLVPLKRAHQRSMLDVAMPDRLLVLSDFEGEFDLLVDLLQANGVLNGAMEWDYGNSHLVIIGDMVDRGTNVVPLLWLIYKLEAEASLVGGHVHYVLGNHERYLLDGRVKSAANKYQGSFRTTGLSSAALWSENTELGAWLRSKPVLLKIGEILFAHGGISPSVLAQNPTLESVDSEASKHLTLNNSVFRNADDSVIHQANGILFYRGYSKDMTAQGLGPKADQAHVDAVLRHFNVKQIAVGHSLVKDIGHDYNGAVLRIDVHHAGGNSQALLIEEQQMWRVDLSGQKHPLNQAVNIID